MKLAMSLPTTATTLVSDRRRHWTCTVSEGTLCFIHVDAIGGVMQELVFGYGLVCHKA